jgi:hypothetical protein
MGNRRPKSKESAFPSYVSEPTGLGSWEKAGGMEGVMGQLKRFLLGQRMLVAVRMQQGHSLIQSTTFWQRGMEALLQARMEDRGLNR